jgi:hypothetical protein
MREPLRIYTSERGIWRIEMRDSETGKLYYSSLRTRFEAKAQQEFAARRAFYLQYATPRTASPGPSSPVVARGSRSGELT